MSKNSDWVDRFWNITICFAKTRHYLQLVVCVWGNVHQHGVSIQISINLDETLLRIARELNTAETWFLGRLFILQSSIVSQILEFIYWTVTIFSFDHMTDENQELFVFVRSGFYLPVRNYFIFIGWRLTSGKSDQATLIGRVFEFYRLCG